MSIQLTQTKSGQARSTTFGGSALEPYTGAWGPEQAAHLLRRAGFGPTYDEIAQSAQIGLEQTMNELFKTIADPDLPINYYFKDDPEVPIGETWVGKKVTGGVQGLTTSRNVSLAAWLVGLMLDRPMNIKEKLILFWHNHLVISDINVAEVKYSYHQLLRKYALGDFKQLVKDMTVEIGMLFYLNGNENSNKAPNENYAREVMELFTIGKGPLVAPGDYTNYTEQDVVEIARALTGWQYNRRQQKAIFNPRRHDTADKQLSHRFNNEVISNLGEKEYEKVIDIIFKQDEVSRFICRQLYIWYVNSNITDEVNTEVIEPMAQLLRDSDYVIEPALKALLSSDHFFNDCNRGAMVKSPIDFSMSVLRTGKFPMPADLIKKYDLWGTINRSALRPMEQAPFEIPSVAGWQAYYQEPVFYRFWLSAVSLPMRKSFVDLVIRGRGGRRGFEGLDLLGLIAEFEAPEDPNALLETLGNLFLAYPLTSSQYEFLKTEILIPGLPDYEWTLEYNLYRADPGDENLRKAVLKRIQDVVAIILNMPEYQLM